MIIDKNKVPKGYNPTRPNNVEDSLEELNAFGVLGIGLLQAVLMLSTLLVTHKIPGHEKVRKVNILTLQ